MPELEFRAYISSTLDDLREEREIALKVIAEHAVVLHSYSASPKPTVQSCIDDVRRAHVYVGIVGHRYGWVPEENNLEGKSITELEYDACRALGQPTIPRLIFRRTKSPDKFRDSEVHPKTADQIRAFRDRIIERTFDFEEINDFRYQLLGAIKDQRQQFHVSQSPQTAAFSPTQGSPGTLKAVVLLHVPGTDDPIVNRITATNPSAFVASPISPTEVNAATRVESALELGQLACLVVTESSLKRMTDPQVLPRFDAALATLKARGGFGVLLRVNVPAAALPEGWRDYPNVEIASEALEKSPALTVNGLFSALAAAALHEPTTQPRKALPVIALAATRLDVAALTAADGKPFKQFADLAEFRRTQFETLGKAARERDARWPADFYGDRRTDWRCFGPKGRTVAELVDAAVAAINQAPRGSRERNAMQLTEIVVRHYSIDEYLTDRHGSRAAIQSVVARGALVCVDEMALFHPDLRDAARDLLTGSRAAIVSLSPCDPAHLPTRALLSEGSFLLESLVARFQAEYDPQCEVSLNSEYRLMRWLRTAIPRLLTEGDGRTGRPTLVNKVESLLAAGE